MVETEAAAKLNHERIRSSVEQAIARLREEGRKVSFYAVADYANVARSTLYRCDDLRKQVVKARDEGSEIPACSSLAELTESVLSLESEVARLRKSLAMRTRPNTVLYSSVSI